MTDNSLPIPPRGDTGGMGRRPGTILETLAIFVTVVVALYFGRDVLVPLAVAVLLSFALGPLVQLLRRWHFGRLPSVAATVILAFFVIFAMGGVIGSQLAHLAGNLPQYQTNITLKIETARGAMAHNGLVERASRMLEDLRLTTAAPPSGNAALGAAAAPGEKQPIPVEIRAPQPTPLQLIGTFASPLLGPLANIGVVFVFVCFFLLQRDDLRDRFIRLAGSRDLQRTTVALNDAAGRLSRYLLTQTIINAGFGVVIGSGLWAIGMPNPVLLGVVAMLLRFVPYIGSFVSATLITALALAVDPGWSKVLWTLALFIIVEPVTGQVIEPLLYGRSTGLSAVAVVIAAAFWTWLWGPIGLLLSTPLTMCLVVLGRHVDRLAFLDVLLGDEPALAREESFYQRILAGHPDEAAYQAAEFLRHHSLSTYYDEVALKGLALAQLDVSRGLLGPARRAEIKEAVDGVIEDLAEHEDVVPPTRDENAPPHPPLAPVLERKALAPEWRHQPVVCVAGRGALDEASAAMLAQLSEKHGVGARVLPSAALNPGNLARLEPNVRLACLCYLEPANVVNARYVVRRLHRRAPQAKILLGLWSGGERLAERDPLNETGADFITGSLREALGYIVALAQHEDPGAAEPKPSPAVAS